MKFLSEQPTVFQGIPARKSVAALPAWEARVGATAADIYRAAAAQVRRGADDALSIEMIIIRSPLVDWEGQAQTAAIQGKDPLPLLTDAQHKADAYLACMQGVDPSKLTMTELQDKVKPCAIQADPQGNW